MEGVKKTKKTLLVVLLILLLVVVIIVLTYLLLNNKNTTNNSNNNKKETTKILTLKIPKIVNNNFEYVEQKYEGDSIPKELLDILSSLKLDEQKLPEGIGFEGSYYLNIKENDKETSYVLTGHPMLCNLITNECFTSNLEIDKIIYSFDSQNNIKKVKLEIPTENNNNPEYEDIVYEYENIPKKMLKVLNSLTLDSERIPDGIGLSGAYFVTVYTEVLETKYVLASHGKFCNIDTKECFITKESIKEAFPKFNN